VDVAHGRSIGGSNAMQATGASRPQFDLDWLLQPVTRADFFSKHWETQPLMVTRDDPHHFREIPGLGSLDELITATATGARTEDDGRLARTESDGRLSERGFRLNDAGVTDIQDIYRAYSEGYSVVINRLHCRSARFALMCRTLENDFYCPIGANLYLTPANSQGFRPHVDTHDVFILQLHGTKEWHVADPYDELPLATAKKAKVDSLIDHRKFVLAPGDTLYIPRGFPHEAVTAASSSLHVTVSVNVFRWIDLIGEMMSILADEHVDLRRSLAPRFVDAPLDLARLPDMAALIGRRIHDPNLLGEAKTRLERKLLAAGKAATAAQFASIDGISSLTESSMVGRVPGILCQVGSDLREARIEFATNFVAGPLRLESAFGFITQHERFALCELPQELSTREKSTSWVV
jgi:bifunctional lysine-specific demethylase and histidyl-hydroxylase NO66